jgi:uncharacterized coiled-coil protein SlyX
MNRYKTPLERYKEYQNLTEEQKQDLQIKICSKLDEINKIMAEQPIVAFNMQEEINELYDMFKHLDKVIKFFERYLK